MPLWRRFSERNVNYQRASQRSNTTTSSDFLPAHKRVLLTTRLLASIACTVQRSASRFSVIERNSNSADAIGSLAAGDKGRKRCRGKATSYSWDQLLNSTTSQLIGDNEQIMTSLVQLFAPKTKPDEATSTFRRHMETSLIGRLAVQSHFTTLTPSDLVFSTGHTKGDLKHCDAVLMIARRSGDENEWASLYLFQLDRATRVKGVSFVEDISPHQLEGTKCTSSSDLCLARIALHMWAAELTNAHLLLVADGWKVAHQAHDFDDFKDAADRINLDYQVVNSKWTEGGVKRSRLTTESAMLARVLACDERPVEYKLDRCQLRQMKRGLNLPRYLDILTCGCCSRKEDA